MKTVFHHSTVGWNHVVGRVRGGLPGAPGGGHGSEALQDVGRITVLFPGNARGTCGLPRYLGPYLEMC